MTDKMRFVFSLSIACPFELCEDIVEHKACPMKYIRQIRDVREKMNIIKKMSEKQLTDMINAHINCKLYQYIISGDYLLTYKGKDTI